MCVTKPARNRGNWEPTLPSTPIRTIRWRAIRELTEGNGADVVFECAGGSPRQGLSGVKTLTQAIDAVRSGGKVIGRVLVWRTFPVDIDLLRERSLRYLVSGYQHFGLTWNTRPAGRFRRVQRQPMITHVLPGIESVPQAFEITANKGKYKAISPAQVML
jgi:threonine dehydrogenase-like Zn-dependent dehydrogenase